MPFPDSYPTAAVRVNIQVLNLRSINCQRAAKRFANIDFFFTPVFSQLHDGIAVIPRCQAVKTRIMQFKAAAVNIADRQVKTLAAAHAGNITTAIIARELLNIMST